MTIPSQYFRAGAGAVILNSEGLVLAVERADTPGAWQLPQGGLKSGEDPYEAICREIAEEVSISSTELEFLDSYPTPLLYELPEPMRSDKTGRGQVQYWFLFRFLGSNEAIDVTGSPELTGWMWVPFDKLVETVATFRRPTYEHLRTYFLPHLS